MGNGVPRTQKFVRSVARATRLSRIIGFFYVRVILYIYIRDMGVNIPRKCGTQLHSNVRIVSLLFEIEIRATSRGGRIKGEFYSRGGDYCIIAATEIRDVSLICQMCMTKTDHRGRRTNKRAVGHTHRHCSPCTAQAFAYTYRWN
jgi:hypothetical protein